MIFPIRATARPPRERCRRKAGARGKEASSPLSALLQTPPTGLSGGSWKPPECPQPRENFGRDASRLTSIGGRRHAELMKAWTRQTLGGSATAGHPIVLRSGTEGSVPEPQKMRIARCYAARRKGTRATPVRWSETNYLALAT
jgi:hypothetical protein